MKRRTDGQIVERTKGRTVRQRNIETDGWTERQKDRWSYVVVVCEHGVLVGGGGGGGDLAIRRTGLIRRVDGGCWASIGL